MLKVDYYNIGDDKDNYTLSVSKCYDSRLPETVYLYIPNTQYQFDLIRDEIIAGESLSDAYKKYSITKIYPAPSFVAPLKWHVFNYREFDAVSRTYQYPDFGTGWIYDQIQKIFDEWYDGLTATGVHGRLQIAPGVIVPKYYEQLCITKAIFTEFKSIRDAFVSCNCSDIIPNEKLLSCLQSYITGTSASFYNIYKSCELSEEVTPDLKPEEPPSVVPGCENAQANIEDVTQSQIKNYALYIGIALLVYLLSK